LNKNNPLTSGSYLNLLILAIFFVLSFIGTRHHEIWLDEAQHFLIARDSITLSELFHACRNEGHPLLWNIISELRTANCYPIATGESICRIQR
jgi:hypothetical protein